MGGDARETFQRYLTELFQFGSAGGRNTRLQIEILGRDSSRYGSIYIVSFTEEYLSTLEDQDALCIRDWNWNPVRDNY